MAYIYKKITPGIARKISLLKEILSISKISKNNKALWDMIRKKANNHDRLKKLISNKKIPIRWNGIIEHLLDNNLSGTIISDHDDIEKLICFILGQLTAGKRIVIVTNKLHQWQDDLKNTGSSSILLTSPKPETAHFSNFIRKIYSLNNNIVIVSTKLMKKINSGDLSAFTQYIHLQNLKDKKSPVLSITGIKPIPLTIIDTASIADYHMSDQVRITANLHHLINFSSQTLNIYHNKGNLKNISYKSFNLLFNSYQDSAINSQIALLMPSSINETSEINNTDFNIFLKSIFLLFTNEKVTKSKYDLLSKFIQKSFICVNTEKYTIQHEKIFNFLKLINIIIDWDQEHTIRVKSIHN